MASTPYTQAQLDALKSAVASGVTSVTYEGRTVHYRTLTEMQTIINTMQREIDAAAGVTKSRQVRIKTGRGLDGPRNTFFSQFLPWWWNQ